VQAVFNPRAAEGGSDGETIEKYSQRAPFTLRARGRAVTLSDYETLAREASSAVAAAYAIPTRSSNGHPLPGWVTVLILPRSQERRPVPSFGLRYEVAKYIASRAPRDVASQQQVYVTGPEYQEVDVEATLAPLDPDEAGDLDKAATAAIEQFLHPLTGGPDGHGWPPGHSVYLSDLAAARSHSVTESMESRWPQAPALLPCIAARGPRLATCAPARSRESRIRRTTALSWPILGKFRMPSSLRIPWTPQAAVRPNHWITLSAAPSSPSANRNAR